MTAYEELVRVLPESAGLAVGDGGVRAGPVLCELDDAVGDFKGEPRGLP